MRCTSTTPVARGWSSTSCRPRRSRWARHVWCAAWVNCRYGAHTVAHEHAREVRPEDGGGLGKAAAGLNTIDRGRRCREDPEPLQLAADLPARFIRGDHRTAADRGAERVIRRARLTRRAMDRVDQAAARHRQVILLLQQGRDLPKRQAELLIEDHPERGRLRPELRGRGAECIGRLERVASLHPLPAALAPSDVDVKGADPHARDREFLLILCRDAGLDHRRLTRRARGGQGRVVVIIDVGRHASTRRAAVRGAGLPPGALRIPLRRLGKRRRLAIAGTPRRIQLSFEPIDLRPQPLILAAQRISVTLRVLRPLTPRPAIARIRRRLRQLRVGHADVMSDLPQKYKYGILDRPAAGSNRKARTR
jgi:hypothetical protein